MSRITQKEYNLVIKQVEKNTCFRFSAGVDDNSAFMVPVMRDGKTVMGQPVLLSWKQLKKLAALKPPR